MLSVRLPFDAFFFCIVVPEGLGRHELGSLYSLGSVGSGDSSLAWHAEWGVDCDEVAVESALHSLWQQGVNPSKCFHIASLPFHFDLGLFSGPEAYLCCDCRSDHFGKVLLVDADEYNEWAGAHVTMTDASMQFFVFHLACDEFYWQSRTEFYMHRSGPVDPAILDRAARLIRAAGRLPHAAPL